jgi:hypothetical protein
MSARRLHVVLGEEVVAELDRLVGRRGRSRFIEEAVIERQARLRQLAVFDASVGAWQAEDHPELDRGSVEHVRTLRTAADRSRGVAS